MITLKNNKSIFLILISLIFVNLSSTLVWAAANNKDYQEVSYDDLLNEISTKKTTITNETYSAFDSVMIHAGLGFTNSLSNFHINNKNFSRYQNGLQLSLGIDLFTPSCFAEGVFKNYGITSQNTESINLKEFDLKIGYKGLLEDKWSYSLATGMANRFLKFTQTTDRTDVNETTPSFLATGGIYNSPNKNISLGFEVGVRTPFVSDTSDRDSLDFAIRATTSL